MKAKCDKVLLGLSIGLSLPLLAFGIYTYIYYSTSTQMQFLGKEYLVLLAPKILSLCLLVNLLPFYLFLQTNKLASVKGVLLATFLWAILTAALFIFV